MVVHGPSMPEVIVSSPNMTHRAILDDVLATDLHLLVEKPLCTTVSDCRAVIAAADARKERGCDSVIWVGLEYRYMPPVARLIQEVHGGAIGAGTGAVVGSTMGAPVAGAVVGGLGGAAIGAATTPRNDYYYR